MRGVSGLGTYQYLLQLRRSQGSIRNAIPSAPQSAGQEQPQGTKAAAPGDSAALLHSLFRNVPGRRSSSATEASTSKQGSIETDRSDTDSGGDRSVGNDGVKGSLSGPHQNHGSPHASARAGSSTSEDEARVESGAKGGSAISQNGTSSQGESTAGRTTGASPGVTSYRQRAINKYLQLSLSGSGGAGLNSVSVTT